MASARPPRDLPPQLALSALHDRIVGTLFGAALGDAIGLYTEFLTPAQINRDYPSWYFTLHPPEAVIPFRRDHHRSPHVPGNWTDDTDHSLLILLSFLHNDGKLDPQDFAERLSVWVRNGLRALDTLPFGLGRTVGFVVRNSSFLKDPDVACPALWVLQKGRVPHDEAHGPTQAEGKRVQRAQPITHPHTQPLGKVLGI